MQVEAAVKDGFDVRGFFYWTLIDNFEWNFAWVSRPDSQPLCCRTFLQALTYVDLHASFSRHLGNHDVGAFNRS